MNTHCSICGNPLTPIQKREQIPSKLISFHNNGKIETANVIPYDDAFYEVKDGVHKGSLVHIFDVIKPTN